MLGHYKNIVAVILMVVTSEVMFSQTWITKAPCPEKRWNPASVVLDGKIYFMGGQDQSRFASTKTLQVYDPATNTWELKTPMSKDRWGLMAAVMNGKIYAFGGLQGTFTGGFSPTNAVEEYDPVADTWSTRYIMPTARGWGGCAVVGDWIYVFGGYDSDTGAYLTTIEKYHPGTNSWVEEGDMIWKRGNFMTAAVGRKIYLIGGWDSGLVQEYDVDTKVLLQKKSMPTRRGSAGIAVKDGKIYVVGGRSRYGNEFEVYDPQLDTWQQLEDLPTPREGLIAEVVDGVLYAITGSKLIDQGGVPFYTANEAYEFVTSTDEKSLIPRDFILSQNYPNPFNPSTKIEYSLPEEGNVVIKVFDMLGREVRTLINEKQNPGHKSIQWDGKNNIGRKLSSGVYFCKAVFDKTTEIKKMLLLR